MDNFHKAMLFKNPEFVPVYMGFLPATWMKYGKDLEEIVLRHPDLFPTYKKGSYDIDPAGLGMLYQEGKHTDEWGTVWDNIREGMDSYVVDVPLKTKEDMRNLKKPTRNDGYTPHGFMFLRLTYLRGFEEAMIDFAEESPEFLHMLDLVCEYNEDQIKIRMEKDDYHHGDVMSFGDDLGMQNSLPVSPKSWRKHLKPCFMRLYQPIKKAGKYVYMHTDGCIYDIIPDLKDCGVDVVNPQIRANGIDNLERVCKGKICTHLDLDRQLFPFVTPQEIREHVDESIKRMYDPKGGLMINIECAPDVPLENIEALASQVEKYGKFC